MFFCCQESEVFLENKGQFYSKSSARLSRVWCTQLRESSFFPSVLGLLRFVWMFSLTTFCFFPTGIQLKFSGCTIDTHSASSLTAQPQTKKPTEKNPSSQSRQTGYSSNASLLHTYKTDSWLLWYTSLQVFGVKKAKKRDHWRKKQPVLYAKFHRLYTSQLQQGECMWKRQRGGRREK